MVMRTRRDSRYSPNGAHHPEHFDLMRRIISIAALALIVAGCAGQDDDAAPPTSAVATVPPTTTPAATTVPPATNPPTSAPLPATTAPAPTTAPPTPAPAPTEPSTTTTTIPPIGTRENPVPVGVAIAGGDWTYTVVGFEATVDDIVLDGNPASEPAPPDHQYVRARLRAAYSGSGVGDPRTIDINLVDDAGATYRAANPCCGPEIDRLRSQPETFTGGAVEGWVYWVVPDLSVFGKFVAFDPNTSYTDVPGGVGFFAVN
jgi:hypothetical protein